MRKGIGVLVLLFCCAAAYPQSGELSADGESASVEDTLTVALYPLQGATPKLTLEFDSILREILAEIFGGNVTPYYVDLVQMPLDNPEEGADAYPNPPIAGVPYALTGEFIPAADDSGRYTMRLYFWESAGKKLLHSEEIDAGNGAAFRESAPQMLEKMLAGLEKEPARQDPPSQTAVVPVSVPVATPGIEHWLYAGLRGGFSLRFFNRSAAVPFINNEAMHFYNFNGALQGSVHLFKYFDLQLELNFSSEYAPFLYFSPSGDIDTKPFTAQNLMIPLLIKSNIRQDRLLAGVLGGVYVFLPLGHAKNDVMGGDFAYTADVPLGYTFGVNSGMKLGTGYLFLYMRWAADVGKLIKVSNGDLLYARSMVMFNIGYEIGLIKK